MADALAFGAERHDAVLVLTRSPADPQIAEGVAAKAVGDVGTFASDDHARIRKLGAVLDHVISLDHAWRRPVVGEIEDLLVGREREPIWPDVSDRKREPAGLRIKPVDVRR